MKRPDSVERQPRRPEGAERIWLGERQLTHESRLPWHPLGGNHEGNIWVEPEKAEGDVDWSERVDGNIWKKNRERPRVERGVSPRLETRLFGSGEVRISLTATVDARFVHLQCSR
jgi:hypothetical protein